MLPKKPKVCIIGAEGWGSAISTAVCNNVLEGDFDSRVHIYVYDELVRSTSYLSEVINERHENIKYLPGIKLSKNLIAVNDLLEAAQHADIIIFATPHHFVKSYCNILAGKVKNTAYAVSLIKGLDHIRDGEIDLFSHAIANQLHIPCYTIMNANSAMEMAQGKLCEITVGCNNDEHAQQLINLLQTENCKVFSSDDVDGVELCNTLKDLVALSAGFIDGLRLGDNTRVTCLHLGIKEMMRFIKTFNPTTKLSTFFESCGIANSVASSYADKNVTFAKNFVTSRKTIQEIEANLLNGRKLLGPIVAREIFAFLEKEKMQEKYPLFTIIHRICQNEVPPDAIVDTLRNHPDLCNYSFTQLQMGEYQTPISDTDSLLENVADTVPETNPSSMEGAIFNHLEDNKALSEIKEEAEGFWKPYYQYFSVPNNAVELKEFLHKCQKSSVRATAAIDDRNTKGGNVEFSFEMNSPNDKQEIALKLLETPTMSSRSTAGDGGSQFDSIENTSKGKYLNLDTSQSEMDFPDLITKSQFEQNTTEDKGQPVTMSKSGENKSNEGNSGLNSLIENHVKPFNEEYKALKIRVNPKEQKFKPKQIPQKTTTDKNTNQTKSTPNKKGTSAEQKSKPEAVHETEHTAPRIKRTYIEKRSIPEAVDDAEHTVPRMKRTHREQNLKPEAVDEGEHTAPSKWVEKIRKVKKEPPSESSKLTEATKIAETDEMLFDKASTFGMRPFDDEPSVAKLLEIIRMKEVEALERELTGQCFNENDLQPRNENEKFIKPTSKDPTDITEDYKFDLNKFLRSTEEPIKSEVVDGMGEETKSKKPESAYVPLQYSKTDNSYRPTQAELEAEDYWQHNQFVPKYAHIKTEQPQSQSSIPKPFVLEPMAHENDSKEFQYESNQYKFGMSEDEPTLQLRSSDDDRRGSRLNVEDHKQVGMSKTFQEEPSALEKGKENNESSNVRQLYNKHSRENTEIEPKWTFSIDEHQRVTASPNPRYNLDSYKRVELNEEILEEKNVKALKEGDGHDYDQQRNEDFEQDPKLGMIEDKHTSSIGQQETQHGLKYPKKVSWEEARLEETYSTVSKSSSKDSSNRPDNDDHDSDKRTEESAKLKEHSSSKTKPHLRGDDSNLRFYHGKKDDDQAPEWNWLLESEKLDSVIEDLKPDEEKQIDSLKTGTEIENHSKQSYLQSKESEDGKDMSSSKMKLKPQKDMAYNFSGNTLRKQREKSKKTSLADQPGYTKLNKSSSSNTTDIESKSQSTDDKPTTSSPNPITSKSKAKPTHDTSVEEGYYNETEDQFSPKFKPPPTETEDQFSPKFKAPATERKPSKTLAQEENETNPKRSAPKSKPSKTLAEEENPYETKRKTTSPKSKTTPTHNTSEKSLPEEGFSYNETEDQFSPKFKAQPGEDKPSKTLAEEENPYKTERKTTSPKSKDQPREDKQSQEANPYNVKLNRSTAPDSNTLNSRFLDLSELLKDEFPYDTNFKTTALESKESKALGSKDTATSDKATKELSQRDSPDNKYQKRTASESKGDSKELSQKDFADEKSPKRTTAQPKANALHDRPTKSLPEKDLPYDENYNQTKPRSEVQSTNDKPKKAQEEKVKESNISQMTKKLSKLMTKGKHPQHLIPTEQIVEYQGGLPYLKDVEILPYNKQKSIPSSTQQLKKQKSRMVVKPSFHPPLNPRVRIPRPPFDVRDHEYHTVTYRPPPDLTRHATLPLPQRRMTATYEANRMGAKNLGKLPRPMLKLPSSVMRSSVLAVELGIFAALLTRYKGTCK